MAGMNKQGALDFSKRADAFANYVQSNAKTLGIEPKYANDMAMRCDMLSDFVEKVAGLKRDEGGKVASASLEAHKAFVNEVRPLLKDKIDKARMEMSEIMEAIEDGDWRKLPRNMENTLMRYKPSRMTDDEFLEDIYGEFSVFERNYKMAGKVADFNPEEIGVEKSGPLEEDADEASYMKDQFSQQENRELRETVEGGDIGPDKIKPEEQKPRPGVQASLDLNKTFMALTASSKNATGELATVLGEMGNSMLTLQAGIIEGTADVQKAAKVVQAASRIIPHVASISEKDAPKLARMASIVVQLASA